MPTPIGLSNIFIPMLVFILYVGVPLGVIFLIYRVIRSGREISAAQQNETQRLLKEAIDLLRENNRLLAEAQRSRPPQG